MSDVLGWILGFLSLGLFKKQASNSLDVIQDAAERLGLKEESKKTK